MDKSKFDFCGWATKNNVKCSDGRTILKDAFKHQDGETVSLVWSHQYNNPLNVLGHALLENRDEGVYAYCTFNDSEYGKAVKEQVRHGDIKQLSICANQLKETAGQVLHGMIREVSLVIAGANPQAYIDVILAHGDGSANEAIIYTGENFELCHAEESKEEPKSEEDKKPEEDSKDEKKDEGKTVQDVFDTMTEEQQNAAYAMVGEAMAAAKADTSNKEDDESKGGDNTMKHNVFDKDPQNTKVGTLIHADQTAILELAKKTQVGSFQTALQLYAEDKGLQHDALSSGFVESGTGTVYDLFPEYKEVRPGAPELITSDQGWISVVMSKVHKSPIARIRTSQVDIRNIAELRARGYKKGKQKTQTGNFQLVRRTTDPQTVYVKSALHRDDIIDITDFDYVAYLYGIDKMMLKEELATAIMLGDGRDEGDEAKIAPDKIRPIWTDDDLYTIHVDVDLAAAKAELQGTNTGANFGDNYIFAEAMITAALYAREPYKGTGTPDYYCTPHALNRMLLARDLNGRRIYDHKSDLASALNVGNIHTAEQFEGKIRTTADGKKKRLLGIITNLADYSLGATKKGEVTHFNQFDIDFNQEKSLLETRCSGALTRVYSAIVLEEDVTDTTTTP